MAEMTIRLQRDPATGKKEIIVSLRGDEDSLPLEHEQLHRLLVDRLVEGGIAKADELGKLTVERESDQHEPEALKQGPQEERRAQSEGA